MVGGADGRGVGGVWRSGAEPVAGEQSGTEPVVIEQSGMVKRWEQGTRE